MRSTTDDAPPKIWHSFNWGLSPTEADSKIALTRHRYLGCSVKYTKVQKVKNSGTDYRKYIYAIGSSCDQLPMIPTRKFGTASTEG